MSDRLIGPRSWWRDLLCRLLGHTDKPADNPPEWEGWWCRRCHYPVWSTRERT